MLDYCRELSKPNNLFRAGSTFDFEDRFTAHIEVPKRFGHLRAELANQKITYCKISPMILQQGVRREDSVGICQIVVLGAIEAKRAGVAEVFQQRRAGQV